MNLPEVINNFNVYNGTEKLIGVTGEVTLPELATKTATLSAAGMLGELDVPVPGQFGSQEQEIPFNNLYANVFDLFKVGSTVSLTLRGALQMLDSSTGVLEYKQIKISYKGLTKKINPGKVKQADTMNASVTLELTYVHIEIDGKSMFKLDKLNNVFSVGGKDMLAEINKLC